MFCQKDDLADVVGIVHELAIDCLQDGVGLATNVNRARQVWRLQCAQRVEDLSPSPAPTSA